MTEGHYEKVLTDKKKAVTWKWLGHYKYFALKELSRLVEIISCRVICVVY